MLLLGIDIGTSSIKVSVVDAATQACIASAQYPDKERDIISCKPGWAEQSPIQWWEDVQAAIHKVNDTGKYHPADIGAIGISYQMHGLVLVDEQGHVLRNSIIWCDSRAVAIGERAFRTIGPDNCLGNLLNSPGNFTAAKLAWVKENEPDIYARIHRFMLPGDFIALQLTGEATTTVSALSEGVFWDFRHNRLSEEVFSYFGFDQGLVPPVQPVFSAHGFLNAPVAASLQLKPGIPVAYKAGDQLNNALSLNVLEPGEVAATAGTSGVIYSVSDQLRFDPLSRVNSFAHINHQPDHPRMGILLCINGTGILNRWVRDLAGGSMSYADMNRLAASVPAGSESLQMLPFGNGAERMLENKTLGAQTRHIDLNLHKAPHFYRAAQEGIAFSFRYGLDIMRGNGLEPSVIRAGKANLFLSPVFTEAFVNTTGVPVELHDCDGSVGAAIGAGIGAGVYKQPAEAFEKRRPLQTITPLPGNNYPELYEQWKQWLQKEMN